MEPGFLAGLNNSQRAAVTSTNSVVQVLAPPGSGKTKTLTARVAYLLSERRYQPQNVICCTFTIKASREMRERLQGLVGEDLESKLVLGTFHSICRRYLVTYGHLIDLPKGFGIADTSDSNGIIKRIIKRLGVSIEAKTARARISHHKARGKRLADLPQTSTKHIEQQEFITVFQEYESALATSNLLDYDDLLLRCVDLLRAHPDCVSNVEALLIDEFQDTNVVQFELMTLLASAKRRITIVGDPDQSIYGFRSAEIENLRRMKKMYPQTVVINLEENYRSASAILQLSQDVIEQDKDRPDKKLKATHCYGTLPVLRRLPNPHEEALWIASEIRRMLVSCGGLVKHSDIAILIRSAHLSLLIEKAFGGAGLPYRMVGGQRFFDRVEIRLIIDYLRTISHPDNNSALLAIINVPSRHIGETTVTSLVKLGEAKKVSVWNVIKKVLSGHLNLDKPLTKPAEQDLGKLINLIEKAREDMDTMTAQEVPTKLIKVVVKTLDLEGYLQKKYKDDYEERIENIKELVLHATEVAISPNQDQLAHIEGVEQQEMDDNQEVLAQFLATIVLSSEVETSEEEGEKSRITISTIHSAKGLEWPVVFVPAMYEGSIPHSRAEDNDEERRLLYVAMTRAQALLTLTCPLKQSRDQGESSLTQFLPPTVHHRLAKTGPKFDEKVISDMATILRRSEPSQEDLLRGLAQLKENESPHDDLWPSDGTHRNLPSRFSTMQSSVSTVNSTASIPSVDGVQTMTTMNNVSAFSTSNMTLGFVSARDQHQIAPPLQNHTPESMPTQKKQKSEKRTISSFFNSASIKPEPGLPSCFQKLPDKVSPCSTEPILPLMRSTVTPSHIPNELSSHKFQPQTTGLKRPRAALEETSANRKHYPFLSSSPTREFSNPTTEIPPENQLTLSTNPIHRPVTTMHTTTMSLLNQNMSGLSKGLGSGRKTLGVRRSFNGWDSRKNK